MSDPLMDQIERGLREMTEPRNQAGREHAEGSTELWKRALEISRAEERAGLVHPGTERAERPRGRRLLYALNAVGVAAMVILAAGVWTVIRVAPETEKAGVLSDKIASVKSEAPERGISLFADQSMMSEESDFQRSDARELAMLDEKDDALDGLVGRGAMRSRDLGDVAPLARAGTPSVDASKPAAEPIDRKIALDPTAAVDDSHPGISQMAMGPEAGLTLEGGDASVMAFGTTLERAEIVIEVEDTTAAFNTIAGVTDADLDEFNSVQTDDVERTAGSEILLLNVSPSRMDLALDEIRGLGNVVEERREPDSMLARVNSAVNWAADSIGPNAEALGEVLGDGLSEHERAHHMLDTEQIEQLGVIHDRIADISRRLEEARRSMNLSQIRVSIRQAPASDTIDE